MDIPTTRPWFFEWEPSAVHLAASIFAPLLNTIVLPTLALPMDPLANFGLGGVLFSLAMLALALFPFMVSRSSALWWVALRSLSVIVCLACLFETSVTYFVYLTAR
jgi:hypothetical protein